VKPYSGGIRHDYKDDSIVRPAVPARRWSWFVLGLALPLVAVSLFLVSETNESKPPTSSEVAISVAPTFVALETPRFEAPIAAAPIEAMAEQAPETPSAAIIDLLVERGDTLDRLFRRNSLNLGDLAAMVALPEAAAHLKLLKPGDAIQVTHQDGRVLSLNRELGPIDLLNIAKTPEGFSARTIERAVETRLVGAHGIIEASLFEASVKAGISDVITMNMAGIFQWDIDFIQDVRVGDSFTVLHEELWRDGVKLDDGRIVAAEFINRGDAFRAARFQDASGRWDYYTPEGRSVRKAFIRAPVDFTRISSNFNPNRRHPVLNTIRAHRGVDYAAPTGTPVKAAGDGKVDFRGKHGGYGNAVILQHGGNITTVYGHLSRFGTPRIGSRVKQGDVIGYVGQSGLATGPHLHYEYRIGGVHRNPRTVELPAADPVPAEYHTDFQVATAKLWRQLDLYQRPQLADSAH